MKILKVIHGYPMRYNAGSEVYSQTLCHGLVQKGHEVAVFSRYENPFEPEYAQRTEQDHLKPEIKLHLINITRSKDRYRHDEVDHAFGELLAQFQPDVVHVGHLNHLSTSLISEAKRVGVPVVFTLHDYWMICPRGQFMQFNIGETEPWQDCDGQQDQQCASKCYSRYISGGESSESDLDYWKNWVNQRMAHSHDIMDQVDLFVAPAKYLKDRFVAAGLSESKVRYLDYGFDLSRFKEPAPRPERSFTFGYIGRHVPAKGIHLLIRAFGQIKGNQRLIIWGRPQGDVTPFLKEEINRLPTERQQRIEFRAEYENQNIQAEVFDHADAIVVPSIWVENSPLVIHEAQQAKVTVITSNVGGMAEYVHHEKNGLLFEHRSSLDLAKQMQRLAGDLNWAQRLGKQGYPYHEQGRIPCLDEHISEIEAIYHSLNSNKMEQR